MADKTVAEAAAELALAKQVLADAEAAHAGAVEAAKEPLHRFDPMHPTIYLEDGTERPAQVVHQEGRDFQVGQYSHCATWQGTDAKGPFERWVYRDRDAK